MTILRDVRAAAPMRRLVPDLRGNGVLAVPVVLALLLAPALVRTPLLTIGALVALVVLAAMLARVESAVLVFVAVAPFSDYARSISESAIKGLGAIVILAWLVRVAFPGDTAAGVARRRGRGLAHPAALSAYGFTAVLFASAVVHPNASTGSEVITRYVSFLGAFVVLLDCLSNRLRVRTVCATYVASCAVAGVFGLLNFVAGSGRAAGPLADPNDFAFFMVAALPLALGLRRQARFPLMWDAAAILVTVAMAATLSRGAGLAVVVMVAFGVFNGVVRPRFVIVGALLIGAALGIGFLVQGATITNSHSEKQYVAQANVNERLLRWEATAHMTYDNPVLGLGPGGFRTYYNRYEPYDYANISHDLDVAHETYLEVSSELGLLGLATFLAIGVNGFVGARRRARMPDADDWLAGSVSTAALGTAVAAAFLTEQYYLPLWLVAALGAAMDPGRYAAARLESAARRSIRTVTREGAG